MSMQLANEGRMFITHASSRNSAVPMRSQTPMLYSCYMKALEVCLSLSFVIVFSGNLFAQDFEEVRKSIRLLEDHDYFPPADAVYVQVNLSVRSGNDWQRVESYDRGWILEQDTKKIVLLNDRFLRRVYPLPSQATNFFGTTEDLSNHELHLTRSFADFMNEYESRNRSRERIVLGIPELKEEVLRYPLCEPRTLYLVFLLRKWQRMPTDDLIKELDEFCRNPDTSQGYGYYEHLDKTVPHSFREILVNAVGNFMHLQCYRMVSDREIREEECIQAFKNFHSFWMHGYPSQISVHNAISQLEERLKFQAIQRLPSAVMSDFDRLLSVLSSCANIPRGTIELSAVTAESEESIQTLDREWLLNQDAMLKMCPLPTRSVVLGGGKKDLMPRILSVGEFYSDLCRINFGK